MANKAKDNLINQIEEQYINLVYTREAHLKCSQRLEKQAECLSRWQIALSAISTAGLISVFIADNKIGTIIGTVCSALLLAISTYIKDKDISSNSKDHIKTAEKLFLLREKYKTLLATCEDKTTQGKIFFVISDFNCRRWRHRRSLDWCEEPYGNAFLIRMWYNISNRFGKMRRVHNDI